MSRLPIITKIENLTVFKQCLNDNPGYFIIKFGADWCGPCKKIEGHVLNCMSQSPNNVQCAIIDVDQAFELYGFLKTKKMVNGIPVILAYKQGNVHYVPDDCAIGSDVNQISALFTRCYKDAITMKP
jgi:thiol-disulfide isomerase/thioredoxin